MLRQTGFPISCRAFRFHIWEYVALHINYKQRSKILKAITGKTHDTNQSVNMDVSKLTASLLIGMEPRNIHHQVAVSV